MTKNVIGLDFGNYNSFVCYVSKLDDEGKLQGKVEDLLPSDMSDGIPSVYFYSKEKGTLCGDLAVRSKAKPVENRVRYLKRHLSEHKTIDGKDISYDEAITEVIQYCVRCANKKLKNDYQTTTNYISLAYPVTYSCAQRQRLIELAEKATLEDGTKIKVYGTIAEPAAAGLDYLSSFAKEKKDTTVLVYDLGGGTFDLALVSLYPEGRKTNTGDIYYYDVIDKGGLSIGGAEFDEIIYDMILNKFNDLSLKPVHKDLLHQSSESVKIALTSDTVSKPELFYDDDYISRTITREEFEKASRSLLMQTVQKTLEIIKNHPNQKPEFILLTGGASQMPMVKNILEEQIIEFKDKIKGYRPNKAIAYGAARFGISELNTDPSKVGSVVLRTQYDLGIRFLHDEDDKNGYVTTYIPANTPLPYTSDFQFSSTLFDNQRYSNFEVYEAITNKPNCNNVKSDYLLIMDVTIDREKGYPKGTPSKTRLIANKLGTLEVEAYRNDIENPKPITNHIQLMNLNRE